MTSKAVDTPTVLPTASDAALREVLRSLQLSPDLIDKSTAAIYAHVRDPIEHPVDKELARLCTSDYTRGALHALCLYLVSVSSETDGDGRNDRKSSFGAVDKPTPSAGAWGAGITNSGNASKAAAQTLTIETYASCWLKGSFVAAAIAQSGAFSLSIDTTTAIGAPLRHCRTAFLASAGVLD